MRFSQLVFNLQIIKSVFFILLLWPLQSISSFFFLVLILILNQINPTLYKRVVQVWKNCRGLGTKAFHKNKTRVKKKNSYWYHSSQKQQQRLIICTNEEINQINNGENKNIKIFTKGFFCSTIYRKSFQKRCEIKLIQVLKYKKNFYSWSNSRQSNFMFINGTNKYYEILMKHVSKNT